ncbi:MAG: 30S ribosomal protein S3Ae [Candidatus Diapherotrites archaeon ADurb.Bin253]|jgi:ribosomal protein S3AE|nr:hypothetical protein [Candidatus Pacearchaeota archaeon]OQA69193.1 MAG: 30S ribosomal protein S3Ae [Candidatus Diapherotrites archaeon ADurb.Bin253]HNZ51947.1 hypothetical protein [Candidatus Pacearchaeota archaeon]HOH04026.1 hypothetical protein [Candidatus Pacearchaeota archaeon]HOR52376.1 hypothetical protein [Candidatus Pacearchaeota archaeon]
MAQAKRKKKFFDVEMPIINKQTQIFAYELAELEGKYIRYDLTRILRGKSILMQFRVQVKDNKAIAIPRGAILMPYFLRRMIRKGTDYVEDSFIAECKDASLKIKPFLITRRKVSKRVRRGLREKAKQEIIKYLKDKPSQKIFEEILKNKMQKDLSILLKKIYPLALCEIKSIEIKKDLEVKVKEKPKEEKQEKEEDIQEKKEKKSKKKEEKEADSKEN